MKKSQMMNNVVKFTKNIKTEVEELKNFFNKHFSKSSERNRIM